MAVSYASEIYTKDRLFFLKLLFRWTGSVWQLLWVDYIFFVLAYAALAVVYHQVLAGELQADRRATFEAVMRWLSKIRTSVPLSFMLGFFVSTVFSRWWNMCMAIPWMSSMSFYTQALVESTHPVKSDIARKIRVTILRYFNLSWILMMAGVSVQIKDRFGFRRPRRQPKKSKGGEGDSEDEAEGKESKQKKPLEFELTWQERLDGINADKKVQKHYGKLVTAEEIETFARSAELSQASDLTYSPEYWLPLAWATRLMRRAKLLGLIAEERELLFLVEMTNKFRSDLGTVWAYSEFNVPLVYTQVAVAAVYLFLFSTLLSTQIPESEMNFKPQEILTKATPLTCCCGAAATAAAVNLRNATAVLNHSATNNAIQNAFAKVLGIELLAYFPVLGSLEFIFYLGWFKIGIVLLNPLGKDQGDLPLSDILNSNLKSSVKLGGAEDSLFPPGLTDNGEAVEQQVALLLRSFDFSQVHAHDNFTSAEEVEAHLHKHLLRRLQGTGKEIVQTLDFLQLRNAVKSRKAATAASKNPKLSSGNILDKASGSAAAGNNSAAAAAVLAAALANAPSSDSLTAMESAAVAAQVLAAAGRGLQRQESMPLLSYGGGGDRPEEQV